MPGEFDAFISYSHAADGRLAPALHAGLEQLARPWRRRRALRVFQDASGLAATPGLWSTITATLDRSRFLVLLASPEAAASRWVCQELEYFERVRGARAILLAVTGGECRWDPDRRDFDWSVSTAVPRRLAGVFAEEPLYVDLRWARTETHLTLRHPGFRQAVGELAAPMHGIDRDELDARDLLEFRRARRARRVATAGLATLAVVATGAAGAAVVNAQRATQEAEVSEAGRLAALSVAGAADRTDVAILLGLHSLRHADTAEGRLALGSAMTRPATALGVVGGTEGFGSALAVGPGDQLAVGSSGGDIAVGAQDGAFAPVLLRGHGSAVLELAFSTDETRLASVGLDGNLVVHDVASAAPVGTTIKAGDAEFLPDGHRLLVAGLDGSVSAIDIGAPGPAWTATGLGRPATQPAERLALAVSRDGKLVAVATNDRRVVLLDAATGGVVRSWDTGGSDANDVAFSGSGAFLAGGGDDATVRVWSVADGSLEREFRGSTSGVRRVAWALDDRTLASAAFDARVRINDTGSGRLVGELGSGLWGVSGLGYGADGQTLFAAAPGGLRHWNLETGRPRWYYDGLGGRVLRVAVSPDSRTVAMQLEAHVELWRIDEERAYATLDVPGRGVAFSRDGARLLVGGSDGGVHEFDTATGSATRTVTVSPAAVRDVAVLPAGDVMALDADGQAVLSDPDGRERWRSPGLASGRAMAVRPDGSAAAFADPAGLVVVDAATGDRIGSAAARPGVGATALAFAPDGTRLAVGWSDGRVEVVDAASGRTLGGWLAHQNQVYDVAFSPDGRLLATGAFNGGGMGNDGFDSGLRLWDAASGRQIADLAYHDAQVDTVVFSADGRWLISAGADREVLLWPAWTQWTERACAVAGRDLTEQERLAYLKAADRAVDVCGDPP